MKAPSRSLRKGGSPPSGTIYKEVKMHGRVFVLADRRDILSGDVWTPSEEDVVRAVSGCDYAIEQTEGEFLDDLKWLSDSYGLSIKVEKVGETVVGVLDKECLEKVRSKLEKDKRGRIERVRKELEKEDPDMWRVAYLGYEDSCFYFALRGWGIMNEMDFLQVFLRGHLPEELLVVGSFDYHI